MRLLTNFCLFLIFFASNLVAQSAMVLQVNPFVFWSVSIFLGVAACFSWALWRRALRLSRMRTTFWRDAVRLLENGNYAEIHALARQNAPLFPPDVTSEVGAVLRTVERDMKQHVIARRELEDVLSSLQDAVLVVDAEARLRFLNAPALQLFNVRIEDVLGAQILEALPSFGLESCVRAALHEGRSSAQEQSLYFVSADSPRAGARRTGQIAAPNFDTPNFATAVHKSSTRNALFEDGFFPTEAFENDIIASETANEISSNARETSPRDNGKTNSRVSYGPLQDARREIFMRVAPVRSSAGAVSGAVAILQDLTEVRRLERVRRDFVANASHELRTPIANIRAGAETILTDTDDAELARRFLPQIVTESERLSRLVSDLLDLAHADAALETPRAPVDFCGVVDAVIERLQDKAAANQIELQCEYSKDDCTARVVGDFASLEQVAFNLIDNALIYTPSGGCITLRVRIHRETEARAPEPQSFEPQSFESEHENAARTNAACEVVFSVADTGIGIPVEDQERVFERFYRVDKARSRVQGGTGLGLAIVKHIVENHHGHVSLQSESGRGTIFTVRLPAF